MVGGGFGGTVATGTRRCGLIEAARSTARILGATAPRHLVRTARGWRATGARGAGVGRPPGAAPVRRDRPIRRPECPMHERILFHHADSRGGMAMRRSDRVAASEPIASTA